MQLPFGGGVVGLVGFEPPSGATARPVVGEIRDWIIEQMRTDMAAIDRLYPRLRLMPASY